LARRITRVGIGRPALLTTAAPAPAPRRIAGVSITCPATTPPSARRITGVGIGGAGLLATATPPARLIAWVGIRGLQGAATARGAAAIAGFITRIGVGFATAPRLRARLVLAGQVRFGRRGRFPALSQSAPHRHGKARARHPQYQEPPPQEGI
jgi:hypothetical protein